MSMPFEVFVAWHLLKYCDFVADADARVRRTESDSLAVETREVERTRIYVL
jgi:hypothetical protein